MFLGCFEDFSFLMSDLKTVKCALVALPVVCLSGVAISVHDSQLSDQTLHSVGLIVAMLLHLSTCGHIFSSF